MKKFLLMSVGWFVGLVAMAQAQDLDCSEESNVEQCVLAFRSQLDLGGKLDTLSQLLTNLDDELIVSARFGHPLEGCYAYVSIESSESKDIIRMDLSRVDKWLLAPHRDGSTLIIVPSDGSLTRMWRLSGPLAHVRERFMPDDAGYYYFSEYQPDGMFNAEPLDHSTIQIPVGNYGIPRGLLEGVIETVVSECRRMDD